jgi:hypothetical protein
MNYSAADVLFAPVITIYVRHHQDCSHSDDHFYKGKGCNCRKRLRWSHNGERKDISAKTRSWAEAERAKRKVEEQFGVVPNGALRVEPNARMIVARARELFLMSKAGQVGNDVFKKYERELKRLEDFLDGRGKFTLGAIDAEDIIEFQAGWNEYGSKQTRRRVITRYRSFFRYWSSRENPIGKAHLSVGFQFSQCDSCQAR